MSFIDQIDHDGYTKYLDSSDLGFIKYKIWEFRGDYLLLIEYPHDADDVLIYTEGLELDDLNEFIAVRYQDSNKYSLLYLGEGYSYTETEFQEKR